MPIEVSYDSKSKKVGFKIYSSNNFSHLVGMFKSANCRFNPKNKTWEIHPMHFQDVVSKIEDTDIINISSETRNAISRDKFEFGDSETEFRRMGLNESLVLYPPVKGKSPNEMFQTDCIRRGIQQNRMALFLPVGSGKTYISTSILNHFFNYNKVDRLLIVAPSEGVINWKRELMKFSTFANKEEDVCVSLVDRNRYPFEKDPKVIVTTYRHFLTWSDDYYKMSTGNKSKSYKTPCIPFDEWGTNRAILLDESHKIKNHKSRTSKVVLMHSHHFKTRLALTGTPTPNSFDEIYPQIKFLDPSLLPNYYDWIKDVAVLGTRFSQYQIASFKESKVKNWEERLSRWVMKYNSGDILDLPELYEKKTYVFMSDLQRRIYEEVIRNVLFKIQEEYGRIIPVKVLDYFPYLRLALDNPEMLKDRVEGPELTKLVNSFKFDRDHAKVEITESIIENHPKDKVIIFDYHPSTIESLANKFRSKNPLVVHGSNTPSGLDDTEWREEQYDIFRHNPNRNLLIASSKVLTTSTNLQQANVLIYFSRDYSYLTYEQSKARAHRIGQNKTVFVYPLIYDMSLDETIDRTIDRKEELNRVVFSKKEALSKNEWELFFKGREITT